MSSQTQRTRIHQATDLEGTQRPIVSYGDTQDHLTLSDPDTAALGAIRFTTAPRKVTAGTQVRTDFGVVNFANGYNYDASAIPAQTEDIHLRGVADPVADNDAVPKRWVEGKLQGLDIKASAAVLTKVNMSGIIIGQHFKDLPQLTDTRAKTYSDIFTSASELGAGDFYDFEKTVTEGGLSVVKTRTGYGADGLDQDATGDFDYVKSVRMVVSRVDDDTFKLHPAYINGSYVNDSNGDLDLTSLTNEQERDNYDVTLKEGSRIVIAGQSVIGDAGFRVAASFTTNRANGIYEVMKGEYDSVDQVVHMQRVTVASGNPNFSFDAADDRRINFVVLRRVADFASNTSVQSAFAFIESGQHLGEGAVVNQGGAEVDATAAADADISFTQFSGAGSLNGGTNITKNGNTFDLNANLTGLTGVACAGSVITSGASGKMLAGSEPKKANGNSVPIVDIPAVAGINHHQYQVTEDFLHVAGAYGAALNDPGVVQSADNDGFHVKLRNGDCSMRNAELKIVGTSEDTTDQNWINQNDKTRGKLILQDAQLQLGTGTSKITAGAVGADTLQITKDQVGSIGLAVSATPAGASDGSVAGVFAKARGANLNYMLSVTGTQITQDSDGKATTEGFHVLQKNDTAEVQINEAPVDINGGHLTMKGTSKIVMESTSSGFIDLKGSQNIEMATGDLTMGGTGGAAGLFKMKDASDNDIISMTVGGNMSLTTTKGIQALEFLATSDKNLKQNIQYVDANDDLAIVMQIKPAAYQFRSAPSKDRRGVIAQDLQATSPGLVDTVHSGSSAEHLAVNYIDLISSLVGSVHALQSRILLLESRG